MTQHAQTCLNCGNPHTPYERGGFLVPLCAECESNLVQKGLLGTPQRGTVVAPPSGTVQDSRFRPLSSLPPAKRLPPRVVRTEPEHSGASSQGSMAPVPNIPSEGGRVTQIPRALPGVASTRPHKVAELNPDRKIGFNCPACLAILVIKQPDSYDWTAAPCPNCQTVILPPRIVPVSPFQVAQSLPSARPTQPQPQHRPQPPQHALPASQRMAPSQPQQTGESAEQMQHPRLRPSSPVAGPQHANGGNSSDDPASARRFPLMPREIARSAMGV